MKRYKTNMKTDKKVFKRTAMKTHKKKYQEMIDRLSRVIDESIIYLSSLKEDNDNGEFEEYPQEYPQEYLDCVDDTIKCMVKARESMKVLKKLKGLYGKQFTVYRVVKYDTLGSEVIDTLFETSDDALTYISVTSLRGDDVFYAVNEITVKVD